MQLDESHYMKNCEEKDMKTRVCLFSRCSTSSQTTENQLKVLREVAAHRDYEVVCEISETVSGAKSLGGSTFLITIDIRT